MHLLLISNSTMAGEPYLGWSMPHITAFFRKHKVKKACFIPYAGVNLHSQSLSRSYDVYTERVASVFQKADIRIESVHQTAHPAQMVSDAEAFVVGGGNTFHLVAEMHKTGLMELIRQKALSGIPYTGWSAGANVACPTLMTTNDMPIVEPPSFNTLGLLPFQINPHYLDANPSGHGGETRQQRIEEYLAVHREKTVAGLREGCFLELEKNRLTLHGGKSMRLFRWGKAPEELPPESDVTFLMI